MARDALLPCPFCGCEAETKGVALNWSASCNSEGCWAYEQTDPVFLSEREAIAAWNRRIERPAPADAAERMLPWTCSECGDRQKLRHEGGGKYSCPSCKQDFYQYDTPAWRDRFAPGKAPADAALAEAVKWANDLAGACRAYRCGVKLGTEADASRLRTLAAYATRAAQERRAAAADATDAFMDIDLDWINDEIESLSFRDAPDTNRRRIDSLIRIKTALLTNKRLYEALTRIAGMNDLRGVPDDEVPSALANALQECEIIAREAKEPGFYADVAALARPAAVPAEAIRALAERWQALARNADEGVKDAEPGGMTSFILSSAAGTFRDCAADLLKLLEAHNG